MKVFMKYDKFKFFNSQKHYFRTFIHFDWIVITFLTWLCVGVELVVFQVWWHEIFHKFIILPDGNLKFLRSVKTCKNTLEIIFIVTFIYETYTEFIVEEQLINSMHF